MIVILMSGPNQIIYLYVALWKVLFIKNDCNSFWEKPLHFSIIVPFLVVCRLGRSGQLWPSQIRKGANLGFSGQMYG